MASSSRPISSGLRTPGARGAVTRSGLKVCLWIDAVWRYCCFFVEQASAFPFKKISFKTRHDRRMALRLSLSRSLSLQVIGPSEFAPRLVPPDSL